MRWDKVTKGCEVEKHRVRGKQQGAYEAPWEGPRQEEMRVE